MLCLLQGETGRSVGTSGWDGLVWRLEYLNAMLCLLQGETGRSVGTSCWDGLVWRLEYLNAMVCLSSGEAGSSVDPKLTPGQYLPFIANTTIKFLGLPIRIPSDVHQTKLSICEKLQVLLQTVKVCPVTRKSKLKLYKLGICPRLNWP